MITLDFRLDGELVGTIEIPDRVGDLVSEWHLSEFKTYETAYVSGHILRPGQYGWKYSLQLERPIEKNRS